MWVFTNEGFFSVVKHRTKNEMLVRARNKKHLEAFMRRIRLRRKIIESAGSDYPFRIYCRREQWQAYLASYTDDLAYDNFKNSVKEPEYHDACFYVWRIMNTIKGLKD